MQLGVYTKFTLIIAKILYFKEFMDLFSMYKQLLSLNKLSYFGSNYIFNEF